jgi:hypothetical protein
MQGFGGGDLREREHLEDLDIDGRILIKCIFKVTRAGARTGFIWVRIELLKTC